MSRYKIKILTLQGITLHFTVPKYEITQGNFIKFTDVKTNNIKIFHASRCEIDELSSGDKNAF